MTMPTSRASKALETERAIIDIGSNTVRLVIYGGPRRAPTVLYNEKVTARLGKGVADNGKLAEKGMAAALSALGRYATILRLRGITDVQTVATAAARDASNGADFLARVAALGLEPRLLSGEEEAVTSAHGVQAAFPGAFGVVGDLGGGSLELIDIVGDTCTHGTSLPLGTLRLPALRTGGPAKFASRVRKLLRGADWAAGTGQPLYLVGGSWRALARFAMIRQSWPIDDPHGFELAPADALKLARSLAARRPLAGKAMTGKAMTGKPMAGKPMAGKPGGKLAQTKGMAAKPGPKQVSRKLIPGKLASHVPPSGSRASPVGLGLSSSRLASLPDAAALLGVLVRELAPSKLIFSGWGLREGLMVSGFGREMRDSDPMLAGVIAFVEAQGARVAHIAMQMALWTARVHAVANSQGGTTREDGWAGHQSLRLAGIMLGLASMRTEPNLRAEQAADWALRKRWIGLDAQGRAMMALAVLANSGRTEIPPELLRLAPIARLREAVVWGLATRLCRRFTGSAELALANSSLAVVGSRLVLSVRAEWAALFSEAVDKDLRTLADNLGLQPQFQAIADGIELP